MKILVADDDLELLGLVAFALRQAGYLTVEAPDGPSALEAFARERPDLVVLDVSMPRLTGLDVLRRIREESRVPVMMLTVRSSEEDVVTSLDLGADDHLAKPFSPRTLLARIRALLRRSSGETAPVTAVGDLALDLAHQTVRVRGGEPVRLTSLEARLLQALLAQAGTPISADRLTTHVWGLRGLGDKQLLKQLVHRLRRKVEPGGEPAYIVTVGGVGYMLRPTLSG
ncbi:MAG TPA: response regulator transcription factor [Candidatus Polarisedimenticolaceae bacterium]|nr:response regulator transcription factor [Candidatus Polarisedimenticolaceae bacterium]